MGSSAGKDACHIGYGEVIRESPSGKSLLIRLKEISKDVWIPKKVFHDDSEVWSAKQIGQADRRVR